MVARGEVWLVRLDPTAGREIQNTRPSLIVSPPQIHDYLDVVIVAPMATGSHPAGYRIPTIFGAKENRILLDQIRSIDKSRLLRQLGEIEPNVLRDVLATLRWMFAD